MDPLPSHPTETKATGSPGQAPAPSTTVGQDTLWPKTATVAGATSGSLKLGTADQPQPYALAIAELEAKIETVNANAVVNLQMGHFPQAQHDAERSLQLRKVLDLVKRLTSPKSGVETNDIGIPVLPIADGGKAATTVSDIFTLPIAVISAFAGSSIAAKMQQSKNDREMEEAHRSAMRSRALMDKTNDTLDLDRIRGDLNAPKWTKEQKDAAFEKALAMVTDRSRKEYLKFVAEGHRAQTNIEMHPNGIYYIDLAEQLATVWWRCAAIGATLQHLNPLKDATVFTVVCEKHGGQCFGADTPMAAWRAAEAWLMSPDREYVGHLPEPLTQGINIHPGNPSDLEPKSCLNTIGNQPNSVDNSTPAS